jgi:hypothetical protein
MKAAHDTLEKIGTNYSDIGAMMSGGNGVMSDVLSPLQSSETQQVIQAQRDFINANLRQESGAAIAASEFGNGVKQYFPRPGDKPELLAQKKRNRETSILGFSRAAGPAAFDAPEIESPTSSPAPEAPKAMTAKDRQQSVLKARAAIKANPAIKAQVIERLKAAGITDHGIN